MTASKGVCLWLTGRSGAGKSTVTKALLPHLYKQGRTVTVLDVVPYLAKAWFEKTSESKLLRKAFVAAEIVRHGGVAICVTVSARRETRAAVRNLVGEDNFVEVFVDAPADVCLARKKTRSRKPPLIKRARALFRGTLTCLPFRQPSSYQPPLSPEVLINTCDQSPEEGARVILQYLMERGFVYAEETRARTELATAESESQPLSAFVSLGTLPIK